MTGFYTVFPRENYLMVCQVWYLPDIMYA